MTLVRDEPFVPFPPPRIETESLPAARLEQELPAVVISAAPFGTLGLIGTGILVLGVGLAALGTGNFIAAEFARATFLGFLTLAVAIAGFGLVSAGIWRELRGLLGLRSVDQMRAALAGADARAARAAAKRFLAGLPEDERIGPAIAASDDPAVIASLLRAGPVARLRTETDALARAAAIQVFSATTVIPSPLFDGLLVGWRGLRLVRQVAALHGVRPGLLGTMALLRRVALSAAAVVTTDVALNTALHALGTNPLLRHVAGDMAGAGVAARRMLVLARATAAACSPVDLR